MWGLPILLRDDLCNKAQTPTKDAAYASSSIARFSTSDASSSLASVDHVLSLGGGGGVSQVSVWIATFAMKCALMGAVTNRKAMINTSCTEVSPNKNECTIEAIKSMPMPIVPTLVGACRRVIGSLNFSSPTTPARINPAATNKQIATTYVPITSMLIR